MKKYAFKIYLFSLFFLTATIGLGQNYENGYKITSFKLPIKTSAFDILQDKDGFVWIATMNGLWRYDGGSFKNYVKNEADLSSITNNHISCLYEDSKGDLWVGTYGGGLLKYIKKQDSFERFVHNNENPTSLSFNEIKLIFETSDNYLFVGTDGGGLNLLDRETKKFTAYQHNQNNSNSLSHNNILSLEESKVGELYVGTWQGLNKLNYQTGDVSRIFTDKKYSEINYHFIKKYDKLYVAPGAEVLQAFNPQNNSLENISLKNFRTRDSYIDKEDNIWFLQQGRIYITNKNFSTPKIIPLENENGISYNTRSIYNNPKTDITWVLNADGSFFRIEKKEKVFKRFNDFGYGGQLIYSGNFIWVVNSREIKIFNKDDFTLYKKLQNFNSHLVIDSDTNLSVWAVDSKFYYHYSYKGELIKKIKRNKEYKTHAIKVSSNDLIWTGEVLGINYLNKKTGEVVEFDCDSNNQNGIGYFHRSRCILEDSKGRMWFGTNGDGLKRFDKQTNSFINYRHKIGDVESLNNNFINTIFEDDNQHLWIGTNAGLCKLNLATDVLKPINNEVLKDKIVNSILQDQQGVLWIGTSYGLVKFNEKANEIRIINEQDGLTSDYIRNYNLQLENGEIILQGQRDYIRFNPQKVKASSKIPSVYLSKLWVNNTLVTSNSKYIKDNISATNVLKLDYTDSKFEIEFRAIHFNNNQRCKYAYKLEGYDDDWSKANNTTKATYTNIPSGDYTFQVKVSNEDGVWNNEIKELKIIVKPPFWELLWVKMLAGLFLIGITIFVFQWFINKEKNRSKLEIEKQRAQQLEEISQMKLRFFTNISHELRTPLTLITAPLNKFSEKGISPDNKVLKMMYRNSSRLLELINQILDFRKLESKPQLKVGEVKDLTVFNNIYDAYVYWAKEKNIKVYKNFTKTSFSSIYFDVSVVQKIIANLISNAVKYTPENGRIDFKVGLKNIKKDDENKIQKGNLIIEIKDNGLGIPEEYQQKIFERYFQLDEDTQKMNSSGIGLSLCAELVALHSGTIKLQSKVNEGAHFTVSIPIGRQQISTQEKTIVDNEITDENSTKEVLLVIEDNADIRNYLSTELQENYTIITADDGKEGVAKAVSHIPNIIISDIMMPEIDGIQLAQQLKANDLTSHIPIIFLTAKTGIDNKLKGLSSGGHDYIQKPFNISEVQLKVKNILKARKDFIKKAQEKETEKPLESVQDSFLIKLNKCLETNLENSSFGVESLCKELGTSRSQLYRKLHSLTGKSIIEYINFYKLSIAMELLKKGNTSVKQVAFSVGFDDSRYFSRIFKSKFGNSPSYYLNQK